MWVCRCVGYVGMWVCRCVGMWACVGVWVCGYVGVWAFRCKLSQLLAASLPPSIRPQTDSLTRLVLFDSSQEIRRTHSPGASTVVGQMFLVHSTLALLPVQEVHLG